MISADFETINNVDDCRVWAWGMCEVGSLTFSYGTDIDGFMESMEANPDTYSFHNLAFDGIFIISWLLKNGFDHVDTRKLHERQFSTLISRQGKMYTISICFRKGSKKVKSSRVKIIDSLKIFPFSVKVIAETFGLPIKKGEMEYNKPRPIGYEPDDNELAYLKNDVEIMARAMEIRELEGMTKITIGSESLSSYKALEDDTFFKRNFPVLSHDMDSIIRKSYKGGYVYCKEETKGKDIGPVSVYDYNSLYPYVLYAKMLPWGAPKYYSGKYPENDIYPLYIQHIRFSAKVKSGNHFPTLQIKKSSDFMPTTYIVDTDGVVDLWLTNVDIETLKKNYDMDVYEYVEGVMFRQCNTLFRKYIDKWMAVKEKETGAKRALAKLHLNSLYGRFGTNPDATSRVPMLQDDGSIKLVVGGEKLKNPVYTALASFTTAYARDMIITAALDTWDRFLYCDTDSLHLTGWERPNLEIHATKLGALKHEGDFYRARYLHAKAYIEEGERKAVDDSMEGYDSCDDRVIALAGCPKSLHKYVNFDNFRPGLMLDRTLNGHKLRPKNVSGGVVLLPTDFSIK